MANTPTSGSAPFYHHQTSHTPSSTPQPNQLPSRNHTPPTSTSHEDNHRPPTSPVLNLSSKNHGDSDNGEDKDEDLDQDISSAAPDEERRIHLPPLPTPRDRDPVEDRLSDMDDEDVDKDECKYLN